MSDVKLVSISKPCIDECDTAAELVAYAARVSNPANQSNKLTAPKLLKYLAIHKHWSPFEMVSLTIEINTTRDIGRQILRHRSFSFQEFSQRYAKAEINDFGTREARLQDSTNRQNSITTHDQELALGWTNAQADVIRASITAYDWALDNDIAKEQARVVLPEGLTQTTMYMAGTLRSWIHYCELRTGMETQKEHRLVAKQCWDIICTEFPDIEDIVVNL